VLRVPGDKGRGRGMKTWVACVDGDMRLYGLKKEWGQNRVWWKGLISGNRPTRASMETRTINQ